MKYRDEINIISAFIHGLELRSKRMKSRSTNASPERKQEIKWCRDVLGQRTREHLIALALLKGRSYASIEPKCRPGNEPNADHVHHIMKHCRGWRDYYWVNKEWPLERVQKALSREET